MDFYCQIPRTNEATSKAKIAQHSVDTEASNTGIAANNLEGATQGEGESIASEAETSTKETNDDETRAI
ncbi:MULTISPECIES: hypothetical protein [unclassified Enterococcus]|uniref:hypothetical protein n=1 Tax=unclassified Enterococcus TaxID=2608891 RepID=UPI001554B38F|nr:MULTISPECIES: hypothetical protein [unclassified Enterococcus]MBS7578366.1 hypothetical protein [Enterococcus sp. MMGLQ5-2]MBS7585550.1 hypothetical protein [Enterococcus sp. MMGLQ5-1]NPD13409.1 hypothetical protein [Enterococcus sp. MMGLQ5-1]NPD38198.1 hypothetical protein [Enterococcus sp. MMGLQ5-2]